MSNLLVNPIVLNAAMASGWKASTSATLGSFYYLLVEKILWETPVTPGDQMVIEDLIAGNILATLTCDTANVSQCLDWTAKPKRWADFQLTKLSSGTVYLYLAT
jgi:hypothetical protein